MWGSQAATVPVMYDDLDEPREARMPKILGLDSVDIYVGSTKVHYRIHKDFLCDAVPYFNSMFKGGFVESTTNSVTLEDIEPTTFDLFVAWLYGSTNKLKMRYITDDIPSKMHFVADLVKLYVWAEQICCGPLMDYTMLDLVPRCEFLTPELIEFAFEASTDSSKLRELVVQFFHYLLAHKDTDYMAQGYSTKSLCEAFQRQPDLMLKVLELLRTQRQKPNHPAKTARCTFHVHTSRSCPETTTMWSEPVKY